MNKLYFLSLLIICFFSQPSNAQCPEGDVIIGSQAEMEAFLRVYPNCTEIEGDLRIGNTWYIDSGINDVSPLSNIKMIKGNLFINHCPILKDLDALNLEQVDGRIDITFSDQLTDVDFLSELESINGIWLYELESLKNINGLANFEEINGNLDLVFLPSLELNVTLNVKKIIGNLQLYNINFLEDLTFLSNLDSAAAIEIFANSSLIDISTLALIQDSLDYFNFRSNTSFNDCSADVFCNIISKAKKIKIYNNGVQCGSVLEVLSLCNNIGLDCPSGSVVLGSQEEVNLFSTVYPNCTVIDGDLLISDGVSDLSPLMGLREITGDLTFMNTALVNLIGLETLEVIGQELSFSRNDQLENLEGLGNITSLKSLIINENNTLNSLSGFNFSSKVLEVFLISKNESLVDISTLAIIDSVGDFTIEHNQQINDVTSLFSIPFIDDLSIRHSDGITSINTTSVSFNQKINNLSFWRCENIVEIKFGPLNKIYNNIDFSDMANLKRIDLGGLSSSLNSLKICDGGLLTEFVFSESLERINGLFSFSGGGQLDYLPFNQLRSVGELSISGLQGEKPFSPTNKLDTIGILKLSNNIQLTDISAFDKKIIIDSLNFSGNEALSSCQIEAICYMKDLKKVALLNNGVDCNTLISLYTGCDESLKNPIGDILISTIDDLKLLIEDYPEADSIFGELKIEDLQGIDQNDLDYFTQIEYIEKGLEIDNTDFESLEVFTDIKFHYLSLVNLDELTELPYFSKIDTLSYISVGFNDVLENIEGLENLSVVGSFNLLSNPLLTELSGLQSLISVGNFNMRNGTFPYLDSLIHLVELSKLTITDCNELINLNGLSNLNQCYDFSVSNNANLISLTNPLNIDSMALVSIRNNPSMISIESFQNTIEVTGSIFIDNNDALTSLSFPLLKYGAIRFLSSTSPEIEIIDNDNLNEIFFPNLEETLVISIENNSQLHMISDFSNLKICNRIHILDNPNLVDISTFDINLNLGGLFIINNMSLSICNTPFICNRMFEGLYVVIYDNALGCETDAQIELACGMTPDSCPISSYTMSSDRHVELYNEHYSECKVLSGLTMDPTFTEIPIISNLQFVQGSLKVKTTSFSNLNFEDLEYVNSIQIDHTEDLEGITFPSLYDIRNVYIQNNKDLIETPGFDRVDWLVDVRIRNNAGLSKVRGLDSLLRMGNYIISENNMLTKIDGLEQIQDMDLLEIKDNPSLVYLPMLETEKLMDELVIQNNTSLSDCSIEAICIHLDNDRTATIDNNQIGCESKGEILLDCIVNVEEEFYYKSGLSVFPNPTNDIVTIHNPSYKIITGIDLVDVSGRTILTLDKEVEKVDLSNYENGIYLLRIVVDSNLMTLKVVKF